MWFGSVRIDTVMSLKSEFDTLYRLGHRIKLQRVRKV